jgi:xylulokinase
VEDIPNAIEIQQIYAPDPAHRKIYDELFREFVNLYRRNQKMYARLNKSALGPEG